MFSNAVCKGWYCFLLLCLAVGNTTRAQVWAEIISRTDTFSILGSCSDNKVRIHNLPAQAHVTMAGGAAIQVSADEYVLCRFYPYNGYATSVEQELTVSLQDKIIYSKAFKIVNSEPSGSTFNPILHATIGGKMLRQGDTDGSDSWKITVSELKKIIEQDSPIQIVNTNKYSIVSGEFSMLAMHLHGPYSFSTDKWMNPQIKSILKTARAGDKLFLENLVMKDDMSGKLYAHSLVVTVSQ